MRTNIDLDEKLLKEAFKYSKGKTKRDVVHQALEEFVMQHRRLDVRELRGTVKIRPDYDHKRLRIGAG